MGIDLLDLVFRIEKEFGVKISREMLLESGNTENLPKNALIDLRVQDVVDYVTEEVRNQNPAENADVFDRVKKHLVQCLGVEESMVIPDAWLLKDLGME